MSNSTEAVIPKQVDLIVPQAAITSNTNVATAQTPKAPGAFRRVLGSVVGGTLNAVAPGVGTVVGGFIRGNTSGPDYNGMDAMLQQSSLHQMAMIGLQQRVATQQTEFSTITNLLKSRHDGEMSVVQNLKS